MCVVTTKKNEIFVIQVDRTNKKNALTKNIYKKLYESIKSAQSDLTTKVIILASNNGIFSSGNDLAEFEDIPSDMKSAEGYRFLESLAGCRIPIIAAVEGPCIGIASTILLHCEKVIADDTAIFSMPFIKFGLSAEAGSSLLLPRLIGYHNAAELLMTGDSFTTDKAIEMGFSTEKAEKGKTLEAALSYGKKISRMNRDALIATKVLLKRGEESVIERIDYESMVFRERVKSEDFRGAMKDFFKVKKHT